MGIFKIKIDNYINVVKEKDFQHEKTEERDTYLK